jgi:hypothetical protein
MAVVLKIKFGPSRGGNKFAASYEGNVPTGSVQNGRLLALITSDPLFIIVSNDNLEGRTVEVNGVIMTVSNAPVAMYGPNVYGARISVEENNKLAYVAPPTVPSMPDDGRTPAESAYHRWKSMIPVFQHHRANKTFGSWDLGQEYFWSRANRYSTRSWRRIQKEYLEDTVINSYNKTNDWVNAWLTWCDWFDSHVVTEESFMSRYNITNVDSEGGSRTDGGAWSWRQRYENEVRTWNRFGSRIRDEVEEVKSHLDAVDVSDPVQSVIEEIFSATTQLGLVPEDDMNDNDDGFLWFTHPDTPHLYRLRISSLNDRSRRYKITHAYVVNRHSRNWKDNPYVDISNLAIGIDANVGYSAPDHFFSDYFGSWANMSYYWNQVKDNQPNVPRHGI